MEYLFREIENKWQAKWAKEKPFRAENNSVKPKYYVLDMFPYPSGAGLHVGHPLGYIASDIIARYKRHKGFNVLHPMGYDSFGLPAEQYAIQTGQHPAITTEENIKRYREQLDKIGFSFDWEREVRTSNPEYYKWTQWIFIQLFNSWYNKKSNKAENINVLISEFEKNGNKSIEACCDESVKIFTAEEWKNYSEKEKSDVLMNYRISYLGEAYVNWCSALGTVLANDEVKDGVSERGGHPVERKLMKQWSMRITAYAQRLLEGLEKIDWPESLKETQRNWIGRSEGTSIQFRIQNHLSPALSKGKGVEASSIKELGYHTTDGQIWNLLQDKALKMRNTPTATEDALWQCLRGNKLGVHFRRQQIISRFIVDFVCLSKKLVVEVDGDIHDYQKEEDAERSAQLVELGYKVIRFRNEEVIGNIDSVLKNILAELNSQSKVLPFVEDLGGVIEVFTTRPDTIFGVSFVTLAPEHSLVEKITTVEQKKEVDDYVTKAKNRSERERQAEVDKVSGVFTGAFVEHPFTGKNIPVWVGDYVLAGYGTGAVMAVPAHDERDFKFAKHFNLLIPKVIEPPAASLSLGEGREGEAEKSWDEKEGKLINSDFLDGLEVKAAIKKAIEEIEKRNLGKGKVNYKLRDAVFGRQRYWGEPIPIYYKNGIPYALVENELPLVLPEVDKFLPTEDGEPPLARAKDWKYKPLSNSPQGVEDRTKPRWKTAADSGWAVMKDRAKELRNNQTDAEAALWQHIKNNQLGFKFRRQQVIGFNIVDFVSLEKKLVIEVDGEIHNYQKEYDDARTRELESEGYKVIRFENKRVFSDIENVIKEITQQLQVLPRSKNDTQAQVLPTGEDLGGAYDYEHTTMPGWAGSSWYFLRYMDANNQNVFADKKLIDYWQNVDLYIGGSEHATGHLLYVRFWTKFLNDIGCIPFDEPAKKLINQGMIQGLSEKTYKVAPQPNTSLSRTGENLGHFLFLKDQKKIKLPSHYADILISAELKEVLDPMMNTVFTTNVPVDFVEKNKLNPEEYLGWNNDSKLTTIISGSTYFYGGKYFDYGGTEIQKPSDFSCSTFNEVEKMSKSKWNVVTPDDICEKFGADTLRLYEMFLGPLEQSKPWNTNGITGVSGFLKKLWKLAMQVLEAEKAPSPLEKAGDEATKTELKTLHKTIKKITEDIERFSFNTSVSNFMICVNELTEQKCNKRSILEPLVILISPYAPHIAEELWEKLGHTESISFASFPICNEAYLVEDNFSYPISFNGKMRLNIELPTTLSVAEIEKEVMGREEVQKHLNGATPKKIIIVPKKIVNIVI